METKATAGFIDVGSAANMLGLTRKAMYARIERGLIPHRRLSERRLVIPIAELKAYIEQLPGVSLEEALANQQQRGSAR